MGFPTLTTLNIFLFYPCLIFYFINLFWLFRHFIILEVNKAIF